MRGSFIDASIGADVFFEIIYPPELEYTYKLKPAKDFGAPFVSTLKFNKYFKLQIIKINEIY